MRKCFCCILVLFFMITAHSQETRFGVKAGLNYSSIIGDLTNGIKFRFSGHAGVFLEVELADRFSFQPELLYSSQGFQFSSDLSAIQNNGAIADQNDFRTNVQFNYFTVPLLAKFSLKDRLAVEFGPQLGFLLNQVTKIKNLDQRDETLPNNRTSTSGNFRLDYGVAAGLAYNFSESVSIQPRFYFGLRNRLNGLENMLQNYNVTIQVSANYTF